MSQYHVKEMITLQQLLVTGVYITMPSIPYVFFHIMSIITEIESYTIGHFIDIYETSHFNEMAACVKA